MTDIRRTVLVLTDRGLDRAVKGNARRISALLYRLRALGCRVLLALPATATRPRQPGLFDELVWVDGATFTGGEVAGHDVSAFSRAVASTCADRRVDAVIAEYAWMAPCLTYAPEGSLRVVDTHDVLHERYASFARRGLDPWVVCSPAVERDLLAHADVVMAIQHRDAATFRRMLGDASRVVTVPHAASGGPVGYRPSTGAGVMFVGSSHDGNLGIRRFIAHSWSRIRASRPDAELRVYGSIGNRITAAEGCRVFGVVDDSSLAEAYASAAVVVSPVVAGSGQKIKVVEALHHGRVVVATPQSVYGMPGRGARPWLSADGWTEFADATIDALADSPRRHQRERAGLRYAREVCGEQQVRRALSAVLDLAPARQRVSVGGRY